MPVRGNSLPLQYAYLNEILSRLQDSHFAGIQLQFSALIEQPIIGHRTDVSIEIDESFGDYAADYFLEVRCHCRPLICAWLWQESQSVIRFSSESVPP